jgi:pSer/pThr/pTyr-binding forkhead associated (FHA) protein
VAKLVFKNGPYAGKSVALPEGKSITLGRNRDIELPLPDLKLSRKHCQIALEGGRWILRDLGSTNGTFLNGARISGNEAINEFDRIVLGDTEIEFFGDEVPLPKPFDSNAKDPFGINNDDDILPENAVPAVPSPPKAVQVPPVPPVAQASRPPALASFETDDLLETGPEAARASTGPLAPVNGAAAGEVSAPKSIAVQEDPLTEALADLRKPLPPEPPESQSTAPAVKSRPQVRFCDMCSGSIPTLDWDLGQAKEVGGHVVCKDCLEKGVNIPPPVPKPAAPAAKSNNLDDIMAGLDEEAVVVDTSVKRHGATLNEQQAQIQISQMHKLKEAASVRPNLQRPVQNPPPKADKAKEGLGDDFEEIG